MCEINVGFYIVLNTFSILIFATALFQSRHQFPPCSLYIWGVRQSGVRIFFTSIGFISHEGLRQVS